MIINLPVPPSVNALYANNKGNGKGRFKTKKYEAWIEEADVWVLARRRESRLRLWEEPTKGWINLTIKIPADTPGDVSNRTKAVEDYLVSRNITGDDKNNWMVSIERSHTVDCCQIEITPAQVEA